MVFLMPNQQCQSIEGIKLLLTAVMNSNPASLSELTARLVVSAVAVAGVVSSDDIIMSADGLDRSATSSVSRRK